MQNFILQDKENMISPSALYMSKVESKQLEFNKQQFSLVKTIDKLYFNILKTNKWYKNLYFKVLSLFNCYSSIQGLYLWGDVGRGKTLLVDLLQHSLPSNLVTRLHYHRFIFLIHEYLKQLQGEKEPIDLVAKNIAITRLLIVDEFNVSDIADAMLLSSLLLKLLNLGVTLVMTSNVEPDDLYKNGLQRGKFLPLIYAIKHKCNVINLNLNKDYRLTKAKINEVFLYPINKANEKKLKDYFLASNPRQEIQIDHQVEIMDRKIDVNMSSKQMIWFEFDAICGNMRGTSDYITISKLYNTVIISNVPVFNKANQDACRRFIALVDEMYERKVHLFATLAKSIDELFASGDNQEIFIRTKSRLHEMQSKVYQSSKHLSF